MARVYNTFTAAIEDQMRALRYHGKVVNTGTWQSVDISDDPDRHSLELINVAFRAPMNSTPQYLANDVKPNLPWAEDHFQERVGGKPLNPGDQFRNWPHYKHRPENDKFRTENEKFTHTYMERFWPLHAGDDFDPDDIERPINRGIRYRLGDLDDLIYLLAQQPYTRQAYLPVFFPEDTGAHHGGRIPCTLGYQFLFREGYLHLNYHIRSCDALRHFRDDIYMAVRLAQWVLGRLVNEVPSDSAWQHASLGMFTMYIGSFHIFVGDAKALAWR